MGPLAKQSNGGLLAVEELQWQTVHSYLQLPTHHHLLPPPFQVWCGTEGWRSQLGDENA